MLNNGVPLKVVSKTLGHAGLAITADVYAKVRPELQRTRRRRWRTCSGGLNEQLERRCRGPTGPAGRYRGRLNRWPGRHVNAPGPGHNPTWRDCDNDRHYSAPT